MPCSEKPPAVSSIGKRAECPGPLSGAVFVHGSSYCLESKSVDRHETVTSVNAAVTADLALLGFVSDIDPKPS